jgi:cell division protein FtsW (lipid II flippase)
MSTANAAHEQARALHRRRANTELGLLGLAVLIVAAAYATVVLRDSPRLPAGVAAYGGAVVALALVAHLAARKLAPGHDPLLLPLVLVLNGLGLVMVRRLDFALAADRPALAPAQALWTVLGVAVFCAVLAALSDYHALDRYRYLIGIGTVVLLVLPVLPVIGQEINGARIWVRVAGLSFQPGELAKLGLVAFVASYLADKRQLLSVATNRIGPFMVPPARAFAPVLAFWGVSLAILILEKDLGLSLLVFGVFVAMLYVATSRPAYVVGGAALFGAGAAFAYAAFGHVQDRIGIWLNLWQRLEAGGGDGAGQLAQSLFALGSGGFAGVGWGAGQPDSIPFVQTDFIFSAFGEETGLLGTTALLLCYFLLVGRGFHAALAARDDFGQLLAGGLTLLLALQVFVIVGGVTRLIPLTGLALPFLSYGGSALIANYMLVAMLMRVSASEPA